MALLWIASPAAAILLLVSCLRLEADRSVTLAWDANSETDVAGYRLYCAVAGGDSPAIIDVGTTNAFRLDNLTGSTIYTFYVTCYNTAGLESEASNTIEYTTPAESLTDPDIITLTPANLAARRQSLIQYIWGADGWPKGQMPGYLHRNVNYRYPGYWMTALTNISSLSSIDYYSYDLPVAPGAGAIPMYSIHFRTARPNGNLFIYHAGHTSGCVGEQAWAQALGWTDMIGSLVNAGYDVLGLSMPLFNGLPPVPITTADGTPAVLASHDEMFRHLDRPLHYFFDQIPMMLDYLGAERNYRNIFMTGIGAGGWTTTVYAALDPRIRASFPVAGSVPLWLRIGFEGLGDSEQVDYGLYTLANYSELYTLAGANGYQLQILNQLDACCFYGTRHIHWVDDVTRAVQALGRGQYEFFLVTDYTDHWCHPDAMALILARAQAVAEGAFGDRE